MANGTGSKAPASKTLNYELDTNVMTQIRTAGLEEAKADAMKGPEGQLFGASSITGYLTTAMAGLDAWRRGKAKGEEETAKLMDAFQQANLTEGWTTSELRSTWIEGEKVRQTDYQRAVRSGDRQKQQDILAQQEKETQQLGKFDIVGKALKETIDGAGLMDDPDAFPPRDRTFLTGYVNPTNLEVIQDKETGNMLMGVEYETTFDVDGGELGNFRDQDELVNLLNDPNSGYRLVNEDGERIEPPLSADNFVEGNRVVRALNSEQITDMVGNSTNPSVEALEIEKQIQRMEKEKSKVGVDASGEATDAVYNFNPTSVSSGYGAMVNNGNAKKLMYGDLDQNSTFAQDFMQHPDFNHMGPEFNVTGTIKLDETTPEEIRNLDANNDDVLSFEELSVANANRRLILKELEKPENINILKEYWGEWMMLKTRLRLFGGPDSGQAPKIDSGIVFGGSSGVANVRSNSATAEGMTPNEPR